MLAATLAALLAGCAAAPSAAPPSAAHAPGEPIAHVYRTVDGRDLKAFVFSPDEARSSPRPGILLFHGGGWMAGEPAWTFAAARRFEQLGLVAVAIEYRLSQGSVTPIEALADTCEALRWVRRSAPELGVDPHRVAGYGVSAGGQLVAAAATLGCGTEEGRFGNGGPDALVLWSPALDVSGDGWFARLLQGQARPADYSPVEHVPARVAPASIVQGAEDTVTPPAGARRFCERAISTGNRCDLHVYPGVGHLLTRNLENQEDDFDPDPAAREDGIARQLDFLRELWPEPPD
jgi:acetyl esterase/lipase